MAKNKISVNQEKAWYLSKTMWVNILVIVGGFFTTLGGELMTGAPLTVAGVANLALRIVTNSKLTLK